MKKSILLLAVALLVAGVGATAQNQVDRQGRRQGHWVRTDKDGSKIFEGDFKDGLETGIFTYYYANGTVRIRNTFSEPGRVCLHEAYDEQGHLLARGHYNQRNRDGQWQFFANDGRLVKIATYSMGVKNGPHIVFEQNGDTAEIAHWVNNHRHGRWWRRIGKQGYITGNYVDGALEGRLVEYDDNGALVRQGTYSSGLKHGEFLHYADGILVVKERWNRGFMNDRELRLPTASGERFVSIHDIVCIAAQGKSKTLVVLDNGEKIVANENYDPLFYRAGDELFALANIKSHITVARSAIQGIRKDREGRDILILEPQPDFPIFPDENAVKMFNAIQLDEQAPLEHLIDR